MVFSDGTSEAFDVVIGADGLNSKVASSMAPDQVKSSGFAGICSFYGTMDGDTAFDNKLLQLSDTMINFYAGDISGMTYTAGNHADGSRTVRCA